MKRFDRLFVAAMVSAVLLAGAGAVMVLSQSAGADDESALVSGLGTFPTTAPTLPGPTLPTPTPPPSDPRAPTPLVEVGSIEIPKIGVNERLREGVTLTVIDHGPAHWPGSAMPGQVGNAVIAGHRTIRSRPFHDIDKLAVGDQIIFRTDAGVFTYEITQTLVVQPRDLWIIDPTPEPTVTLFACHPKGSAKQRYVVKGKLVVQPPQLLQ